MLNKKLRLFYVFIVVAIIILLSVKIFNLPKFSKPNPTIVFVGDSMTEFLGNFDELRGYLKEYYPKKQFLLLNYGFGSTNILSVQDRLEKDSSHLDRTFQAINNIPFDLIIIESFGHNPLSEHPLKEGLKLQETTLDKIIHTITQKHPKASIIFMATIAPNKERYAEGVVNLTTEKRQEWAKERDAYIQNHIAYAKSHRIPLINIYEQSLDENNNGNIDFINSNDFIHPSPTGIYYISGQIADFLYKNRYF